MTVRNRFGTEITAALCTCGFRKLTRASGEMADALASGASVRKDVGVQVPPRAPNKCLKDAPHFQIYIVFRDNCRK